MSPRILVVDDDVDTLTMMRIILQRRGFEALTALGGAQAFGLLSQTVPDLLLLDVMMPQIDGYEICRRIKADPRTAHVPVLMLSAKSQPSDHMAGLAAGAEDYIEKPIHPDELIQRIQAVLEQSISTQPGSARLVAVGGVKGGVGATTLAINLALTWACHEPILVDLQVDGGAAIHLGLAPARGLSELLMRAIDHIDLSSVEAALTPHASGLRLLAAADKRLDLGRASVIFNHLLSVSPLCLCDLGWELGPAARAIIQRSSDFVLVLDADRVSLARARQVLKTWREARLSPESGLKLVWINRAGVAVDAAQAAIRAAVGRGVTMTIGPAAQELYQALEQGQPLVTSLPAHPTAVQIQALAACLWEAPGG